MARYVELINRTVWGVPLLVLILGVGLFLSIRTGFAQFALFPQAVKQFFCRSGGHETGGVSQFQALCAALAATVGTGNLVGVAGAIALGGPGAIFWMWVCALLGMVTKFAEATLAVRYRIREKGEYLAGPMYMIREGLGKRWAWLATLYCFFGVTAAFGVGNATQINAVITGINGVIRSFGGEVTPRQNLAMGLILAVIIGMMLLGGARRIGRVAEILVPFASAAYLLLCIGVLIVQREAILPAFKTIVQGAFSPEAVTGGALGAAFASLRVGVSRGVFTNEAGMGTASIAHGSAEVGHPVQQGLMGILEVFLDTIVICTMTALVILVSGVTIPYGQDVGAALTVHAFSAIYGDWVLVVIAACLCCFAVATVLGWGLYGARCAQYLFGASVWKRFVILRCIVIVISAVLKTGTVWLLAEIVNGLMAIPNLLALGALTPELIDILRGYYRESLDNTGEKVVK